MFKESFIGSWKLVSSEFYSSDGNIYYPLGKNAAGMLVYDSAGNMPTRLTDCVKKGASRMTFDVVRW